MYEALRQNRYINTRYTRALLRWYRRLRAALAEPKVAAGPAGLPVMPAWLQEQMRALAAIEPELMPPGTNIERYAFYSVPMDVRPGSIYASLSEAIGNTTYSHVFLIPWLKQGGADRGILYHVRAIADHDPTAKILVLTTENADSPWAERLPARARHVSFGYIAGELDFNQQVAVAVRALIQLRAPMVHLVNSRVGWEAVLKHGLALTQHSRFFASLYCDDYDEYMNPVGYARDYLRYCYPYLSTVFCDNSSYPRIWSREIGIPDSCFTVLPFPYDGHVELHPDTAVTAVGADRVLWAGRLDRQKRPDLLAAIAERMPDVQFDVYGKQVMEGNAAQDISQLQSLPNVTLHGEFQRLESVVKPEHFAYLHTTAWEGTPTILFDVAAARLPVCAPAVGGIGDFLSADNLIASHEDVDTFVAQLQRLRTSLHVRNERVQQQLNALVGSRRWEHFTHRLTELDGYIAALGAESFRRKDRS